MASVTLTIPAPQAMIAGTTHQLGATTLDAAGNTLAGRAVTWATGSNAVATVTADGRLSAVDPGQTTVTATSEGVVGMASITVLPIPVASVVVTPGADTLLLDETRQLQVMLTSSSGAVLSGRTVTWSSTDPQVAAVASTGLVTAYRPGTVTITAASEGREGTARITVPSPPLPVIASISPSPLVPGVLATITGQHFGSSTAQVAVGSFVVNAASVNPSEITFVVPCVPGGSVPVRVRAGVVVGDPVVHPLEVPRRTLAPGQSLLIGGREAAACNEFPATGGPARYLLTVYSVGTSANTQAAFVLLGRGTEAAAAQRVALPALRDAGAGPATPLAVAARAHERAHLAHMARDRAEVARLQARMAAARRVGGLRALAPREPPPSVGATRNIYYAFAGGCGDSTRIIRARAVYVGPRAVLWEDEDNELQSARELAVATAYRRLAELYERDQHASVAKYFGDPLRRDNALDDDDRVHMVFTQRLNGTGAAAYVTGCDQFPRYDANGFPVAPASNFGEFFYAMVPTTLGFDPSNVALPDGWYAFLSRTVVHEVKHIASVSARVDANAPGEVGWLEEGSARMAEEMWVRDSLHRTGWRSNAGFGTADGNGLFCDFHLADATCGAGDAFRRPTWGLRRHFDELRPKLLEPWEWSPYGNATGQGGAVFYNTTWSLLRYAIDRHATSEEAFLTALTRGPATGLANILAVSGTTADQLIGGWGMALYADDYPGMPATNLDLQFRTWNLRSVYGGLNASALPMWRERYPTAYPVQPAAATFGGFAVSGTLRGGAHAYVELSGDFSTAQVIALHSPDAPGVAADLRLAIARLQ